jgi:hypothetical protein
MKTHAMQLTGPTFMGVHLIMQHLLVLTVEMRTGVLEWPLLRNEKVQETGVSFSFKNLTTHHLSTGTQPQFLFFS